MNTDTTIAKNIRVQATSSIFKSWCRMFGGQVFLLLMNAWCLRLFTSMVGTFIANPLSF